MTDLVAKQDGRYLATFARGALPGRRPGPFRRVELPSEIAPTAQWLIANGLIYPTDSSINVAIGQAGIEPRGLSLEAQDEAGRWVVVAPDLGFPAGKNKTILVDLARVARAGVAHARRLRLRTNLEIYWDSLAVAERAGAPAASDTMRVAGGARRAALPRLFEDGLRQARRPGNASLRSAGQRRPALARSRRLLHALRRRPRADSIGGRPLRHHERGRRAAPVVSGAAAPAAGRARDFVLIGDGWVKDGDLQHQLFENRAAAAVARPSRLRRPRDRRRSNSKTIRSIGGTPRTGRPITRDS